MEKAESFSTADLMNGLLKTNSLDGYLQLHESDMDLPPFHAYITSLCQKYGETTGRAQ